MSPLSRVRAPLELERLGMGAAETFDQIVRHQVGQGRNKGRALRRCCRVELFAKHELRNRLAVDERFELVEFAAFDLARRSLALDLDRELADARDHFSGFRFGRDRLSCGRRLRRSLHIRGGEESQCEDGTGDTGETQEAAFLRYSIRP